MQQRTSTESSKQKKQYANLKTCPGTGEKRMKKSEVPQDYETPTYE